MTLFRRVTDRARRAGGEGSEPRYLFVARFSATDAMLLRELVSQIAELVGGTDGPGEPGQPGQLRRAR